ncbi:hypothetical protein RDI58_014170 [Solanum bulbocastanum]|uniref:Uncharacterized protein n=1 Tax=Solanum bulbocastanum TaxID=147425 RepID=A0AAN8TMB0_SOLBU
MEAQPSNRRPKFNQRELICAVVACLCYVCSLVCFSVHAKRKNLAWKLKVVITMYILSILFTVFIGFQKFGYIRRDFVHVSAEFARACNLIGPLVTFWVLPLFDGEYSNVALFAMLLGSVCLATTLMFIAQILGCWCCYAGLL